MTDTEPSSGKTWRYRFAQPGGIEIEVRELSGDDAAEALARELSEAQKAPVIVDRHNLVDWEYVTEVDERR